MCLLWVARRYSGESCKRKNLGILQDINLKTNYELHQSTSFCLSFLRGSNFLSFQTTGIISCSTSVSVENFSRLIDTGATDRVLCSLNLFASYKPINNVFINLPMVKKVILAYVGTVHLFRSLLMLSMYQHLAEISSLLAN